ncbi:MAG: NAD(P)H-hydrate dehydratase, partial [Planctomycetales bacterium]|nr:NAD(P)H-hydrate dehydratase [Planctomycetales bacterium]
PNYMTVALPDTGDGQFSAGATQKLVELANHSTSVGIGPGMSRSEAINKLVADAYEKIRVPAVFDADALNALAQLDGGLPKARGPRVLTPHVGEFRRLVRDDTLSPAECRACAPEFACRHGVIVVLKGHRSLVTDGQTTHENDTGNPGMATGGSGDVLTGVISSLLSQDLSPLDAAILGVHVHGLAGDIACSKFGEVSLDAENVKDCLSEAFMKLADD